jgi:hypothetical protein
MHSLQNTTHKKQTTNNGIIFICVHIFAIKNDNIFYLAEYMPVKI